MLSLAYPELYVNCCLSWIIYYLFISWIMYYPCLYPELCISCFISWIMYYPFYIIIIYYPFYILNYVLSVLYPGLCIIRFYILNYVLSVLYPGLCIIRFYILNYVLSVFISWIMYYPFLCPELYVTCFYILNYTPNGRRRLGGPLKGLLGEVETGLSRPNWWRLMTTSRSSYCDAQWFLYLIVFLV